MAELCKLCNVSENNYRSLPIENENEYWSSDSEDPLDGTRSSGSDGNSRSGNGNEEKIDDEQVAETPLATSASGDGYRRRRGARLWKTAVVMPSGRTCEITQPLIKHGWKCGDKTKFITLNPTGRMGKKEYEIVADEMEKTRRTHASGAFSGYDITKIEKISNACLWNKFRFYRWRITQENGDANELMLWHGSAAIQDIVQNGFDERHASQTGMFGAGLYFAENSSKSNQYVYGFGGTGCKQHSTRHCFLCERQILLCRVLLGKAKEYTTGDHLPHAPPGYHSVKGVVSPGGLQYTENIVYRGEQVYPEYLITYKMKP